MYSHGVRNSSYSQQNYFNEFGIVVDAIQNDPNIPTRGNLVAPSVNTGPWTPESVFDTGFLTAYDSSLGAISVEQ